RYAELRTGAALTLHLHRQTPAPGEINARPVAVHSAAVAPRPDDKKWPDYAAESGAPDPGTYAPGPSAVVAGPARPAAINWPPPDDAGLRPARLRCQPANRANRRHRPAPAIAAAVRAHNRPGPVTGSEQPIEP